VIGFKKKKKEYSHHAHWSMLVTPATAMLAGRHRRSIKQFIQETIHISQINSSINHKSTHP